MADRPLRVTRSLVALSCVALLSAAAGCGGDDEEEGTGARTGPDRSTQTTERTEAETTATEPVPEETGETQGASPEDQPGGAGDEDVARSPAFFTGRGGQIGPRVVRVPPFLAIRVELRSSDQESYGLRFGKKSVVTGSGVGSASTTLDGLRPGRSITGTPIGAGNRVRIEASAEPGP
jgi:hypothetical protein